MRGYVEIVGLGSLELRRELSQDEASFREYEVADATSDETIDLAGVAAVDVLILASDRQITYKLNGSAITLDAGGVHVLFGTNVTSLAVSNASGATATLTVGVAGT